MIQVCLGIWFPFSQIQHFCSKYTATKCLEYTEFIPVYTQNTFHNIMTTVSILICVRVNDDGELENTEQSFYLLR